jgi:hypothetical protein
MNQLQALTLLRDAVQLTKGVYAGLWYDGPNQHCTIGALTQVAMDIGFPQGTAIDMMSKFKKEAGTTVVNKIVEITDSLKMSPEDRRAEILSFLDNEIAALTEKAPVIPTPSEITNAADTVEETKVPVIAR